MEVCLMRKQRLDLMHMLTKNGWTWTFDFKSFFLFILPNATLVLPLCRNTRKQNKQQWKRRICGDIHIVSEHRPPVSYRKTYVYYWTRRERECKQENRPSRWPVQQQVRKATSLNGIFQSWNYFCLMRYIIKSLGSITFYPWCSVGTGSHVVARTS